MKKSAFCVFVCSLVMGEVIGEGKFGIVRKALYNENITVAVKSLKGL